MFIRVRRQFALAACAIALGMGVHSSTSAQTPEMGEGYIRSSDGVELYYRVSGTVGDTLIVLHGGPGLDMSYLFPDLGPLAHWHVLISYDQRGAGRSTLVSDTAEVSIDAHVADLEAVRRHFGMDSMALLGHSWGALLAARYAVGYPGRVAHMVLMSPAPPRRTPYMQQLGPNVRAWMDSTTLAELEALSAARRDTAQDAQATCHAFWQLFRRGYFADPHDTATLRRMRGDFCTAPGAAIRNGLVVGPRTWASLGEWDWRNDFADVSAPVLVITGTRDIFDMESMHEWEAAFPNAHLVLLEGAGHYPHLERPDELFSAVRAFLR
jgi:proline iminopeptidase